MIEDNLAKCLTRISLGLIDNVVRGGDDLREAAEKQRRQGATEVATKLNQSTKSNRS